ncbi:HetZ-related protein [Oculatella sp. LEGE 06141]|uniref:HetZ-related protein n=1 Tax=Oculatella sp. LEGE 06141 TaxID=1828648 RepID=UPI001880CC07|nr:HetZ-related protein [Oculatella sp. LEGE 06141]MBE9180995.1 HetZ-related protein [Oculatella sp. LEGE 06141]
MNGSPPNSSESIEGQNSELLQFLLAELQSALPISPASAGTVALRIATEVDRICTKSDRIQTSGQIQDWQITLARHRLQKCLTYYRLGSRRGRVELHTRLSAMVYRQIAPARANLGFQARYTLIEDFLQGFYIESMNAFRRENQMEADYTPKTRLELAEYMAFTEHYAKRRIGLPGRRNQQLVVLRAQGFAHRQPPETALDVELATEAARSEEAEAHSRSPLMQQVREQMVSEAIDPADSVLRDRVVSELVDYLNDQGQSDCVDYLTLKLQDLSAPEIDDVLGLSARQRDYLQQRFKYHVEKFARSHRWQLVHQWLGADLDQNLGMPQQQWEAFLQQISPEQRKLLELKGRQEGDREIARVIGCTPKQVHRRWVNLLELAWQVRNNAVDNSVDSNV